MRIGDLKRSDYRTSIYRMRKMEGLQGLYGVHALEIGYTPLLCSSPKYNSLSTVNLNELAQSVNQFLWIILQFLKCSVSNPTIYIYGYCSLLINCTFHGSISHIARLRERGSGMWKKYGGDFQAEEPDTGYHPIYILPYNSVYVDICSAAPAAVMRSLFHLRQVTHLADTSLF